MAINANGCWEPDVFPKQLELMQVCREQNGLRKFVLCNGPRWSSKSWACLHAVADHAWNTRNGSVCILCESIPAGSSSGIWTLLTEQVLPRWIAGEFGFNWAPVNAGRWKNQLCTPRQDGATKKLYCYVTNKFGGRTRIELNSLKEERDVEKEFKNRYFSMIYWSEMSNFSERKTFDTLIQSLRIAGLEEENHILLADTNPADTGEEHFAWKLWYQTRTARPDDLDEAERPMQKSLKLVEFVLDDNLSLSEQRKKDILASFAHDPDLLARYGYGRWVKSSEYALFIAVFKPSIHVIGNVNDADPEMLLPDEACAELITGWDPGGANPAAVILEMVFRTIEIEKEMVERGVGGVRDVREMMNAAAERAEKPVEETREESVFKFLDELAFQKEDFSYEEFTELFLYKMDFWERWLGRILMWQHWSDRSAFNTSDPISKKFAYQEIYAASAKRILLQQAIDQSPGTVGKGVRLWRKLLFQNRLYFSAARTPQLIAMNQNLKRDRRRDAPKDSIAKGQSERHILDAGRYPVMRLCWNELQGDILALETASNPPPKIITARL